jgi:hypothetical protein
LRPVQRGNSGFFRKKYSGELIFLGTFTDCTSEKESYNNFTGKLVRYYPPSSPDFSPEKDPKAPGLVTFHALTAIWRLPSRFPEVDKMGMIAFYAGLFIGVLFGFLFSSLWVFSRAKLKADPLPDPAEGYSQVDPLKP